MKHEEKFKEFLSREYCSPATGASYSPKVVSDTISRCRRMEKVLGMELSAELLATKDDYLQMVLKVKSAFKPLVKSTKRYPYASYIHALKIYYLHVGGKPKKLEHRRRQDGDVSSP